MPSMFMLCRDKQYVHLKISNYRATFHQLCYFCVKNTYKILKMSMLESCKDVLIHIIDAKCNFTVATAIFYVVLISSL